MSNFLFKDRDGQTPLPLELQKDLIPKNIQTMGELDEYEELNIVEGLAWLKKQEGPGTTHDFWLTLHKRLFCDVWGWAGKVRTHELNNPDFLPPHQIWGAFKQLEGDLTFWIREETFSKEEISARFHERIETIHPFPNGNGRFGRILVEHFCEKSTWSRPTWGDRLKGAPEERRKAYIGALDFARKAGEYKKLVEFMYS